MILKFFKKNLGDQHSFLYQVLILRITTSGKKDYPSVEHKDEISNTALTDYVAFLDLLDSK